MRVVIFIKPSVPQYMPKTNIFESDVTGTFTSVDNINEDPRLRNPASGDYRLQGNSPAIDAGADVGEVFDYQRVL